MGDPLLQFKVWEGEDPEGDHVSADSDNLLHYAGGGASPGDGYIHLRLIAGALSTRRADGVPRMHVVDGVLPADIAAQLGLVLFEAARQSGFELPEDDDVVDAEIVDG